MVDSSAVFGVQLDDRRVVVAGAELTDVLFAVNHVPRSLRHAADARLEQFFRLTLLLEEVTTSDGTGNGSRRID